MRWPPARRWREAAPGFPQSRPQTFDTVIPGPCIHRPLSGRSLQHKLLFFLNDFIYLFLFWAALGFPCCMGFSLVATGGASLHGGAQASHCGGFSCCRARVLSAGSVLVAQGLSCSMACVIFPDPGIESVSPALAGRFLCTVPPGKPNMDFEVKF